MSRRFPLLRPARSARPARTLRPGPALALACGAVAGFAATLVPGPATPEPLAAPAATSSGTTACAARDRIVKKLASAFGETRRSIGLGANNGVVEVFASEETGTWTITVTLPDGTTCLIASGQAWEDLPGESLGALLDEDA